MRELRHCSSEYPKNCCKYMQLLTYAKTHRHTKRLNPVLPTISYHDDCHILQPSILELNQHVTGKRHNNTVCQIFLHQTTSLLKHAVSWKLHTLQLPYWREADDVPWQESLLWDRQFWFLNWVHTFHFFFCSQQNSKNTGMEPCCIEPLKFTKSLELNLIPPQYMKS